MGRAYVIEMEDLDPVTCRRLLGRELVGRIGFVDADGEIAVLPVNAGFVGTRIVVRTAAGGALASITPDVPVAFEMDHAEPLGESGWSVLVRGRLHDVTTEAAGWSDVAVRPWAPGPNDRWLALHPSRITGKRITRRRIIDRTATGQGRTNADSSTDGENSRSSINTSGP